MIDALFDVLPHGAKRAVLVAFASLLLLSSGTAMRMVTWYAHEKATDMVQQIGRLPAPTTTPSTPGSSR